jgi:hypothetical protein
MTIPRDLLPMALLALATIVAVSATVVLGELLRRAVLAMLSALVPVRPPEGNGGSIEGPPRRGEPPDRPGPGVLPG